MDCGRKECVPKDNVVVGSVDHGKLGVERRRSEGEREEPSGEGCRDVKWDKRALPDCQKLLRISSDHFQSSFAPR